MSVEEVTTSNFRARVLESDLPVVVDFHADWCGPCHRVSPIVEQLSEKWAGRIRFVKVDTEAEPDVAAAYRITSIPAILLFDGEEAKGWSIGAKPGYAIERELRLKKHAGKVRRRNR